MSDSAPLDVETTDNASSETEAATSEENVSQEVESTIAEIKATSDSEELLESELSPEDIEKTNEASQPFVGQWNNLVSTTNWEKGRIIQQWRETLMDSDAPAAEYSDEAWALRVGSVTGQHVGRLRRVYARFGMVCEDYEGLYWSHFHASIDWDDAEMWLEGAVQNNWSVSQMRRQRWETLGAVEGDKPNDADIVTSETDEDFEPSLNEDPNVATSYDQMEGPRHEGPDFGDEEPAGDSADGAAIYTEDGANKNIDFVKPFENLGDLPEDLADSFESFKLAILRHKSAEWEEISRDDVLASLDALKELAMAPSSEDAPF